MLGAALYVFQERLLFLPSVLEEDYRYDFEVPFEERWYFPEPGVKLNALYFKTANPKGLIFYSHGNAGDLSRWGHIASTLTTYGYDVMVWDYRTYGKSKGKLSEEAIYRDAQYIFDQIKVEVAPNDIVLYGRSLGTGVVSYLAANNSSKSLILETPYYSIPDVAKYRFPYFPVEKLVAYKFPNYQYLTQVSVPVTIIHGTDDKVVPFSSAKKLAEIDTQLKFIEVSGGGHNNLSDFEAYQRAIADHLE
jgi:hypothetical protein